MRGTMYRWGPGETPAAIRWLIIITCVTVILSAMIDSVMTQVFKTNGPQSVLGLSWYGLSRYYIWQPISYLFVQETSQGIHFFFLLGLAFNMYILWILGSTIHERLGSNRFLLLYLLGGAFAGLAAIAVMPLINYYSFLFGPSAAILAVFVVWTMYNPNSELLLFFLFPLKTKWILTGVLASIFIISVTSFDLTSLVFYFSAAFFGYLFGLISLQLKSPFEITHTFDEFVIDKVKSIKRKLFKRSKGPKIVDINSGQAPLDDEAFIDAMLTKISKFGEQSLTFSERQRMDQISKKKQKK